MANSDIIMIEGRACIWREIRELRRRQLAAAKVAYGEQPALFELKDDCRPAAERTGAGRYQEPTLFSAAKERE